MHSDPEPTYTQPVEAKVKAMALVSYLTGIAGMAALQTIADDASLISFLPDWVEMIVLPLVPSGLTALAGWKARHTPRPDLPQSQR